MVAWGAATWFQTPAQQVRLINAAPEDTAVVIGLNAAALHGGIALGTALGLLLPLSASLALAACASLASLCLMATRRYGQGRSSAGRGAGGGGAERCPARMRVRSVTGEAASLWLVSS